MCIRDSRNEIIFLWLNLERTLDKRRRKVVVVRNRQLKKSSLSQRAMTKKGRPSVFFQEKIGWHHQLPARVTPTPVTPLLFDTDLGRRLKPRDVDILMKWTTDWWDQWRTCDCCDCTIVFSMIQRQKSTVIGGRRVCYRHDLHLDNDKWRWQLFSREF